MGYFPNTFTNFNNNNFMGENLVMSDNKESKVNSEYSGFNYLLNNKAHTTKNKQVNNNNINYIWGKTVEDSDEEVT